MLFRLLRQLIWLRALCILVSVAAGFSAAAGTGAGNASQIATSGAFALPEGTASFICFGNAGDDELLWKHNCGECCLSLLATSTPPTNRFEPVTYGKTSLFRPTPQPVGAGKPRAAGHYTRGPPLV